MNRPKEVATSLIVVVALAAFAATSASAAKPEFSPLSGNSSTSAGGKAKFTEKGGIAAVECTSSSGSRTVTGAKGGTFSETFKGCTALLSGKCTGLTNSTAGEITVAGTFALRYIKKESDKTALAFLIEPVHFECEKTVTLISVKGCVAGEITPINTKTKTFSVALKQSGGVETIKEILNEAGTASESCVLKAEKNGEAEKEAGQENTDTITLETEEEVSA
jgi:hypothetical protein